MTIASAFNEIAVAQGGTADNSGTIAGAVDALTDALAGSDQPAPQTIEQGVRMLGEHIGGGGNLAIATGTFTPSSAGAVETFTTDYNGSGYPVFGAIYVVGGYDNAGNEQNREWIMNTAKNAIGLFTFSKMSQYTQPQYTGSYPMPDGVTCAAVYKSSDKVIMTQAAIKYDTTKTFNANGNPNGTSAVMTLIVRSANDFAYLARSTNFGFSVNVTYKYIIVYSE